jgi:hypothetical protein
MMNTTLKQSQRLTLTSNRIQLNHQGRQSLDAQSSAHAVAYVGNAQKPQLSLDTKVNDGVRTKVERNRPARAIASTIKNSPPQTNSTKSITSQSQNGTFVTSTLNNLGKRLKSKRSNRTKVASTESPLNASAASNGTRSTSQSLPSNQSNLILKSTRKTNRKNLNNHNPTATAAAASWTSTGSALATRGRTRLTSISLTQPIAKLAKRRRASIKSESPASSALNSSTASETSTTTSNALNQAQTSTTPIGGSDSLTSGKPGRSVMLAYVRKGHVSTFGRSGRNGGQSNIEYVRTVQHNGRSWLQSNVGQVQLPVDDASAKHGHVVELLPNGRLHVRHATSVEQTRFTRPKSSSRTAAQQNQPNSNGGSFAFNPFASGPESPTFPDFSKLFSFPSF